MISGDEDFTSLGVSSPFSSFKSVVFPLPLGPSSSDTFPESRERFRKSGIERGVVSEALRQVFTRYKFHS